MTNKTDIKYQEAFDELQGIVNEIENEDVDVDQLTEKVKRATELIKICKEKLKTTKESVQKVLAELDQEMNNEIE